MLLAMFQTLKLREGLWDWLAAFPLQFCTKDRRYFKNLNKTQLRMVCISTEWCFAIKAGFFPLAIALTERSFFRKAAFPFPLRVMPCDKCERFQFFRFPFQFCEILLYGFVWKNHLIRGALSGLMETWLLGRLQQHALMINFQKCISY